MPQGLTQATVNKLVKGMITEAGELTFPEEATIDELNCVLMRDGSRQRRKGLAQTAGSSLLPFDFTGSTYSYYIWKNAGGNNGLNYLVLQAENPVNKAQTLFFFDLSAKPITDGYKAFRVNLHLHKVSDVINYGCQFTQIFGRLIVVNPDVEPLCIQYNKASDNLTIDRIKFVVRDFEWQSPTAEFSYAVNTSAVTDARRYDTYNAGWFGAAGTKALNTYIAASTGSSFNGVIGGLPDGVDPSTIAGLTNFPPLTFPWYSAKDASGNFSVAEFEKIHAPTSIAGNGLFRLDFFNKDRASASGISALPIEVEERRFATAALFAGRVFYAGLGSGKNSGKILFSQVSLGSAVDNLPETLGMCYQSNDPTAEDFNDLLDTDGGEIIIPEANNILRLHPFNDSLFVLAENGVWVVSGIDGKFSPSAYFVSKVSNTGIETAGSFISVENVPFWWSRFGIHTLSFDQSSGFPVEENISISTIQSFYEEITPTQKSRVFADYDLLNKKVFWWYPDPDEINPAYRNRALILDIPLKAFYPWRVAGTGAAAGRGHVCSFYTEPFGTYTFQDELTTSAGVSYTIGGEDVYVLAVGGGQDTDSALVSIYFQQTGPGGAGFRIGQFSDNTQFLDFGQASYDSYFETGYFFAGDLLLKKNSPFITVYMRVTEEGFTGNETSGYTAISPSSLIVKSYWDFAKIPSSTQQVYRPSPFAMVNPVDLDNNQMLYTAISTRVKIRGRGRSMRLRFEAEEGKNFIFLGYSVLVGINGSF